MFVLSLFASERTVQTNYNTKQIPFLTWEVFAILLIFTVVFGCRYNVGVDYFNYEYYFKHEPSSDSRIEFLFAFLTSCIRNIGFPKEVYFSLWVFLQLFFLLYTFKNKRELMPYLIFAFICGQYFLLWMNVIRQDLATCIFIYSTKYIKEGKFFKYLFWIVVASGFHITALALIVFYPIFKFKKDYFKSITLQLILLFMASYVYLQGINLLGDDLDYYLTILLNGTSYDHYAQQLGYFEQRTADAYLGASFITGFLIDFFLIVFSKSLKKYFNSDMFLIFYNLYFLGNILGLFLGQSILFLRPVRYLRYFELVVVSYLMYYLYKNFRKKIICASSLLLIIISYLYQFSTIFRIGDEALYLYQSSLFH